MRDTDRARVLMASFDALQNGIVSAKFVTGVTDVAATDWHLIIDLQLTEGPVAKFCDLLFHGSPKAHELNAWLFVDGGLDWLRRGIENFAARAEADRRRHRKINKMRGKRRGR